jgi:Protein of unknown function (DUF2975)
MVKDSLDTWLRWLHRAAALTFVIALCEAVALVVIGFIPGSQVSVELPSHVLSGLDRIGGLAGGVVVDDAGTITLSVADPSLGQRLIYLLTVVPGLLVVAELGRRVAVLLRAARLRDPFTAATVRQLTTVAKIAAVGGLAVGVLSTVATWVLSGTVLTTGHTTQLTVSPLGWFTVGLVAAAFAQLVARGVAMRTELDTVI